MISIYNFINEKLTLNRQSKLMQNDWTIYDAKKGDIITATFTGGWRKGQYIFIYKRTKYEKTGKYCIYAYCGYDIDNNETLYNWRDFEIKLNFLDYFKTYHKSTEDEKKMLFDAMKQDEYKWDPDKKRINSI